MILLDTHADTFPVGLAGTPFEEVYRALRIVAADAWSVDPLSYRAGMAWGFYALYEPAALSSFRDVVVAALISAMAPMVKDTQTDSELVEYLRQWRIYTPTFPKLQNLYKLFGADVDIEPISDPESQAVLPVDDTRLAFYIRIESVDFARPLSLAEAYEIAVRATPMGSRPFPYYAIGSVVDVPAAVATPLEAVTCIENWEPAVQPIPPVPVLPTVTEIWTLPSSGGSATIQSGYANFLWVTTPSYAQIPYDSTVCYAVAFWRKANNTLGGRTEFSTENISNLLAARNVSSNAIEVYWIKVAVCSSNQATVVPVYDSSNVAYNALKFTSSGTDYYYVLDSTQTDWTDDLSSIGYHLPTVAWFNSDKSNYYLSTGRSRKLYDNFGNRVSYDSTKTYLILRFEDEDGVDVTPSSLTKLSLINDGGILSVYSATGGPTLPAVASVYYLVTSFEDVTYYYYDKSYTSVSNNSWVYLYLNGSTTIPVSDISKYELLKYYSGSSDTTGSDYGAVLGTYNGKLIFKNVSGATVYMQRADIRVYQ